MTDANLLFEACQSSLGWLHVFTIPKYHYELIDQLNYYEGEGNK